MSSWLKDTLPLRQAYRACAILNAYASFFSYSSASEILLIASCVAPFSLQALVLREVIWSELCHPCDLVCERAVVIGADGLDESDVAQIILTQEKLKFSFMLRSR